MSITQSLFNLYLSNEHTRMRGFAHTYIQSKVLKNTFESISSEHEHRKEVNHEYCGDPEGSLRI